MSATAEGPGDIMWSWGTLFRASVGNYTYSLMHPNGYPWRWRGKDELQAFREILQQALISGSIRGSISRRTVMTMTVAHTREVPLQPSSTALHARADYRSGCLSFRSDLSDAVALVMAKKQSIPDTLLLHLAWNATAPSLRVSVFFEEGLSFKGALYYQTLTDSKKLVRNDDATISGQNDDVKCDTLDITVPILTSPDKMIYV